MMIIEPWERKLQRMHAQLSAGVHLEFFYLRRDIERRFVDLIWQNYTQRSQARALLSSREREV